MIDHNCSLSHNTGDGVGLRYGGDEGDTGEDRVVAYGGGVDSGVLIEVVLIVALVMEVVLIVVLVM